MTQSSNLQSPISDLFADRQRQWRHATPDERIRRIQIAMHGVLELARLHRQQRQRLAAHQQTAEEAPQP